MWFRNLLVYRLTQQISLTEEELTKALQAKLAKPCTFQELATFGFVAPFGKGEDAPLTYVSQDFYLIAARKEERILPTSVVKKELQAKVDEIEAREARKIYKKEKDQLKDEIVQDLILKTFTKETVTYAAIAPQLGLILIDTTSTSKAEELLSTLREALGGSLPIRPLTVKVTPSATLTDWVKNYQPVQGFHVLEDCVLKDTYEEGGLIRCKRQDLSGEEILTHLRSGMIVTQLALSWQDKLSFILDDRLGIKRIKFEDILLEEADKEGGDAASQFDATFTLMMLTLAEFIPELIKALGGYEIERPY